MLQEETLSMQKSHVDWLRLGGSKYEVFPYDDSGKLEEEQG